MPAEQLVTELIIDARAAASGAAAYEAAMAKAQAAAGAVDAMHAKAQAAIARTTATMVTGSRSVGSVQRQYDALRGSIDAIARAEVERQRAIERATGVTAAAVRKGIASQQEVAAVMQQVRAKHDALVDAARRGGVANDNFGRSVGLARHELVNLSRQVQDVGVSLASGQSPFTVLVQQGTQIADVFAASGGSARGFAAQLAAMLTPARLLAGGFAAMGAAAYAAYAGWKSFALALDDAARSAGIAAAEMAKLQAAASFKGIGSADFAEAMGRFGRSVYDARNGMGGLADVFRANRVLAKDFGSSFEQAAELIKNARDDQQRLVLLQQMSLPATMEWVRLMRPGADGIRRAKEEAVAFGGAVNDEMVRQAREFEDAWNKALTNFGLLWRAGFGGLIESMDRLIDKARAAAMWAKLATPADFLKNAMTGQSPLRGGRPFRQSDADAFYDSVGSTFRQRDTGRATVDHQSLENTLNRERERIGVLGEMASVAQRVRGVEIEIEQARLRGVAVSDAERRQLLELARARELGIGQMRLQAAAIEAETRSLFMSTGEAAAFRLEQEKINEARERGRPLQRDEIDATRQAADAIGRAIDKLNELRLMKDIARDFTTTLVQGLMQGKSALDALSVSFANLASTLANAAINDIVNGQFVSGAVKGVAAVASWAVGSITNQKDKKALADAQDNWRRMADQVAALTETMRGVNVSPLIAQFRAARQQMTDLAKAAWQAQDYTGLRALQQDFVQFTLRTVSEFERGNPAMSDFAAGLKEAVDTATLLRTELARFGSVGADVEAMLGRGVTRRLAELGTELRRTLERDINAAVGRSFINEIDDLVRARDAARADARVAGIDPALVERRFIVQTQRVVDGAGLIGDAFSELITLFPELASVVHASTDEMNRAAEEQREALLRQVEAVNATAHTIVDYVAELQGGRDSALSPLARLQATQASYLSQYALAAGGNADAQAAITKYFESYRGAARDYYGSGAPYQQILQSGIGQLLALPPVQQATDPVVLALRDVVSAVNTTTSAVGTLTNIEQTVIRQAIESGNASAIRLALASYFDQLNVTADQGLTFDELVRGVGPLSRDVTVGGLLNASQLAAAGLSRDVTVGGLLNASQLAAAGLSRDVTVGSLLTVGQLAGAGLATENGNLWRLFQELDGNGNGLLERTELVARNAADIRAGTDHLAAVRLGTDNLAFIRGTDEAAAQWTFDVRTHAYNTTQLLNTSQGMLAQMVELNRIASGQLELLNAQLTGGAISVVQTPGVEVRGYRLSNDISAQVNNNLITALNKIVFNTRQIADNTELTWWLPSASVGVNAAQQYHSGKLGILASGGWIAGGIPGRDSVLLGSRTDIGMPGEFVVRRDVAQDNAWWLPRFNDSGRLPRLDGGVGAADSAATLAELRELRREVAELRRTVAGSGALVARAVVETGSVTTQAVREQTRDLAAEQRQSDRGRKVA